MRFRRGFVLGHPEPRRAYKLLLGWGATSILQQEIRKRTRLFYRARGGSHSCRRAANFNLQELGEANSESRG